MNFLDLSNAIPNKQAAVTFLKNRGIVHLERRCRNGHHMTLNLSDRQDRWRCGRVGCRVAIPLRNNTC